VEGEGEVRVWSGVEREEVRKKKENEEKKKETTRRKTLRRRHGHPVPNYWMNFFFRRRQHGRAIRHGPPVPSRWKTFAGRVCAARNVPHHRPARTCPLARALRAKTLEVQMSSSPLVFFKNFLETKQTKTNKLFSHRIQEYTKGGPTTPMKMGHGGTDTPHPLH